jgi:SNF2 family DNA or RNA helicase
MRHHNTPVFATKDDRADLKRIYGYTRVQKLRLALFPAFLPFSAHVVNDFEIVYGKENLDWAPAAKTHLAWLDAQRLRQQVNQLPRDFEFTTEPFDHQREGVLRALYEPRTALYFDCGLGKTKTAIDLIRALHCCEPDTKALVICPPHLAPNWEEEFRIHDGGDHPLRVLTLLDKHSKTIDPTKRKHAYYGTRKHEPNPELWPAKLHPDLLYEPVDRPYSLLGDWDDLCRFELEYCEATIAGDQKAKTSLRGKMSRRAKNLGVKLTPAAKMLAPRPEPAENYDVIVLPYSIVFSDANLILDALPFNVLICDESHMLRSPRSNRSKGTMKLANRASRRYLLSGTPALGTPMHLYTQLTMLGGFLTNSWWEFYKRYNVTIRRVSRGNEHDEVVAFKALNVLNEIVTEVSLRKKAEHCLDLPPVRTLTYPIYVGDETREMYNSFVADSAAEIAGREVRVAHAADRLTKLLQVLSGFVIDSQKNYQLCDGGEGGEPCPNLLECVRLGINPYTPKCAIVQEDPPKLTEFLGDQDRCEQSMDLFRSILTSPANKVIVWATFRAELDMLQDAFEAEGWDFVRVDGKTKDKEAAKNKFNTDPDCRIYLSQIRTGVGITLNAANYTVYYNATFDLGDYVQSQKRNDRIGQTRPVTVYQLVVPGSVNEYIFRSLEKKEDISAALTNHIQCILCDRNKECAAADTKPFDEKCIYSTKEGKLRMRPALLK